MLAWIVDGCGSARVAALSLCIALLTLGGCGAKTSAVRELDAAPAPQPEAERCNGADDDFDGAIDEDFRDDAGNYLTDAHCGACGNVCAPASVVEREVACTLLEGTPTCAAVDCIEGYAVGRRGRCVELARSLCLECGDDEDCGAAPGARCTDVGGEPRCVVGCQDGCPSGYRCDEAVCVPEGGSCRCGAGDDFDVACAVPVGMGDPDAPPCIGRARCLDGVLSECSTSQDICDEVDNDCDGVVDQDFVDARGAYSLSLDHCGQCGVSCVEETGTDLALRCGGDPFAPTCVVECEDAFDGEQPGDMLDGDYDILNGCECRLSASNDLPGPVGSEGEALDVDCDGADGEVVESYYVASDGDDEGPGSPTRPLRSLAEAFDRVVGERGAASERTDIFVAGGTYTELLEVPAGVRIHGGYRRDFRRLDRAAFETEIRAPAEASPSGAALIVFGEPGVSTLIEGLTLRGSDASAAGQAAAAAVIVGGGDEVTLRDSILLAGRPGEGESGADGAVGAGPTSEASDGAAPRTAAEDTAFECLSGASNMVQGGRGGRNTCDGAGAVHGGSGGSAGCPEFGLLDSPGADAAGASGAFGGGGVGGQASRGPIVFFDADICPSPPCCGLADFTVPGEFTGPEPGEPGRGGTGGGGGDGCSQGYGSFSADLTWSGSRATAGTDGSAGFGGGGGGAGGGSVYAYQVGEPGCEHADGLGGGGGGGGAGGCGGTGGRAGRSGAPSVALLVLDPRGNGPVLTGLDLRTSQGAEGGPGGAGGEGGAGGSGAFGGALPSSELTVPPLAAAWPGARGGKGGDGGSGGGGGGGCGGASVGIWVSGGDARGSWSRDNRFELGEPGAGGAGGTGGEPGGDGASGGRADVHVE